MQNPVHSRLTSFFDTGSRPDGCRPGPHRNANILRSQRLSLLFVDFTLIPIPFEVQLVGESIASTTRRSQSRRKLFSETVETHRTYLSRVIFGHPRMGNWSRSGSSLWEWNGLPCGECAWRSAWPGLSSAPSATKFDFYANFKFKLALSPV